MTPAQTDKAQVERMAWAMIHTKEGLGIRFEDAKQLARAAIDAMQPSVAEAAKVQGVE